MNCAAAATALSVGGDRVGQLKNCEDMVTPEEHWQRRLDHWAFCLGWEAHAFSTVG